MERRTAAVSLLIALASTSRATEVWTVSGQDLADMRSTLESAGLRVTHVLPDGRLVVVGPWSSALQAPGIQEVRELRAPDLTPAGPGALLPLLEEPAEPSGLAEGSASAAPSGTLSPVLAGTVALGLVLPESTGLAEPSETDWTALDVEGAIDSAVLGTLRFALAAGAPPLTFVVRLLEAPPPGAASGTVACAYEARRHTNFDEQTDGSWLAALGYPGEVGEARRALLGDLIAATGADAGYLAKVVNDRGLPPGRASARIGGPQVTWFLSSGPYIAFHETAHAFGALDEYCPDACRSPSELSGVAGGANANSRGNDGSGYYGGAGEGIACMMMGDTPRLCPHTRSQLGWIDLDEDGTIDLLEPQPVAEIRDVQVQADGIVVTGQATLRPHLLSQAVSIGRLSGVEVRVAGGSWMPASPCDGAFDSPVEGFRISLPPIPDGDYTLEARALAR